MFLNVPIKLVLLANWGLGETLLKYFLFHPLVKIVHLVTRNLPEEIDPWINAVATLGKKTGIPTTTYRNDRDFSMDILTKIIEEKEADLLCVHAFMKIIPEKVFSIPPLGTVNIHPSLLPAYRGPSPTAWVLKNRERSTGLTAHMMDTGMDTGPIIHQIPISIDPDTDTMTSVIDRMKESLPLLMDQTIKNLLDPDFRPVHQNTFGISHAPKINLNNETSP